MNSILLATAISLITAAPLFESRGDLAAWDTLDYEGDVRIEQTVVTDCPPGFGPEAIRLSGSRAVLLAKGGHLSDGTFVALYREGAAATDDADGVTLFGGAFGDELGLEHNTKTMRPHVWLEQDNDTGISFRYQPAEGEDHSIKESVAVGLVTDSWNVTGWIWQKVEVNGDRVRAKYWPAHRGEPAEWHVETTFDLSGDRFGIRINSGEIDLAYFAADGADISIPAPADYLYLPRTTVSRGDSLPLTLFGPKNESIAATYRFVGEDGGIHGEGSLMLERNHVAPPLALPPNLLEGSYRVELSLPETGTILGRSFDVVPPSDTAATLRARRTLLDELQLHTDGHPAVAETTQVAAALLALAQQHYDGGKSERATETLRFVDETLAELHGVAGAALRNADVVLDWETIPAGYDGETGVGSPKQGMQDHYRTASRIRFGEVIVAKSFVMGQDYTLEIPFEVSGVAPATDYSIHVALRDPLGVRTVAETTITPNPPTSQWVPGKGYPQQATLHIPRDDTQKGVSQPVVLDEMHDLLVSVRDDTTGAYVLLANPPGKHPNRVGQGYAAIQIYVSSAPVEIQGFQELPSADGHVFSVALLNRGPHRSVQALFRILDPSGRPIGEYLRKKEIAAGGVQNLVIDTHGQHRGNLTAEVSLYDERGLLTQMRAPIMDDDPEASPPTFTRANHVETLDYAATVGAVDKLRSLEGPGVDQTSRVGQNPPLTPPRRGMMKGGTSDSLGHTNSETGLFTPIQFSPGGWTDPLDITIRADGEILCTYAGLTEATTLYPPPHFGYYDITATSGDTTWHERMVATVIETGEGQLLVNGEPFLVKGVNVHGMDSRSPSRTRLMMDLLKDLGFNSLRGDYPPRWQIDMAHEAGLTYDVLAPFSVSSTAEIFARQDGPPLGTARAVTRQFIERYADAAAVLLWNSCNEIVDENIPFLLAQHPAYGIYDPYRRPVHYANLYGQDLWQGQDVMGVNYYFSDTQKAVDRHPLIERSAALARAHGLPMIYTEYNSYHGAIPTTGVEAMEDLFSWGIEEAGMAGGYFYMMPNSDRHPGVLDGGYNTHRIMNDAFHRAFDDARVRVVGWSADTLRVELENVRPFALRRVRLALSALGNALASVEVPDIPAHGTTHVELSTPAAQSGNALTVTGTLHFETHHGLWSRVPVELVAGG